MSHFSGITVEGYNRSIIEKAGLKAGQKIKVNNDSAWLISIHDNYIEVDYSRQDGSLSVVIFYESRDEFRFIESIEGVEKETIALTSQNKAYYDALEETLDNAFDILISQGARELHAEEIPPFPLAPSLVMIEYTDGRGFFGPYSSWDGSQPKHPCGIICAVESSELMKHSDKLVVSRSTVLDEVLCYLNTELQRSAPLELTCWTNYFTQPSQLNSGYISKDAIRTIYDLTGLDIVKAAFEKNDSLASITKKLVNHNAQRMGIDAIADAATIPTDLVIIEFNNPISRNNNTLGYGLISNDQFGSLTITCPEQTQNDFKILKEKFDFLPDLPPLGNSSLYDSSIKAIYTTSEMLAEQPVALQLQSPSTPYLISNQPDGALPDMTDFSLERVGSIDGGWNTSSTIKAGRALAEGEVLSAFLIDRLDGDIRRLDYPAQKGQLSATSWPKAFADHLAAAGEPICAGAWQAHNSFSTTAETLRLWSPTRYRTFSNAPFAANIVQALACDESFSPVADETLCLQVRDLTSQALYEHHFFTPAATQAGTQWAKALCEQINRDSHVLRAGVLDGSTVTPADKDNAFWVPQCAELSVTLTQVNWWQSQAVEGEHALEAGHTLQAWVYDAFSHRLLAHHEWVPGKAQRAAGKWLGAWATALNASPVSPYLRAATHNPQAGPADASNDLHLWQRGDALRIFTTLPGAANYLPGPTLQSAWRADTGHAVLATVRHPFSRKLLHRALFKPQDAETVSDRDSWLQALAEFLKAQAWPEVQVGAAAEPLSVLRFSELQVLLENVGDGEAWRDDDYGKYLLETDDLPSGRLAEQARFTVTAGTASVQVDVQSLNGELEFRLDNVAYENGYRVTACVPRAGEHRQWPVSVTDTSITWAGPIDNGVYDLYFTYPGDARDAKELTVGHIGGFNSNRFWHDVQAVKFTPPAPLKKYTEISFLCEDFGNTSHSELFDTSGHDRTGVDERSGLFHAHYPIATMQGLRGLGPVCDLTLHYSALRGNEAGLGDGWAWRFSSIITSAIEKNDHRRLTLADSTQVMLSDDEWTRLGAGESIKTKSCRVSCNKDYSRFTLEFPSGRQEILSKPDAPGSDTVEPNDEFRRAVLEYLQAIKSGSAPDPLLIPEHWTQWALLVISPYGYLVGGIIDYREARNAWRKHSNTKELDRRIALFQRPFVQLLPSRIISQFGEALDLQWKRQNGQFLLMSIKSGEAELFSAQYVDPELKAESRVNMHLWHGTGDAFEVELTLKQYLLSTLKRVQKGIVVQQVDCGYDDDPTLDRVLCRLQEQDGSLECVQYVKESASLNGPYALPRVALHALLPGCGQQNHIDRYSYTGSYQFSEDAVFIAAVESGIHAAIAHDLHAFGLDHKGMRTVLLRGSGSSEDHWLEFYLEHGQATTTFRYTGWGDELAEITRSIIVKQDGASIKVTANAPATDRRLAVLQRFWRQDTKRRKQLSRAIMNMLSLSPKTKREQLGKTVDATTIVTDAQGNPLRLYTNGSHSIHYCYNHGDQTHNQITVGNVQALGAVPTLECPFVPAYTSAPLMAEYQCDDYGNPQGLKLYGYRKVTRDDRDYLELAEMVMVDNIRGTLTNDTLDKDTTWELTGQEALWHQISTSTAVPASKKTPSGQSEVQEWSITSRQTTHRDDQSITLTTVQKFIDNPTQPGIQVIVSATTPAGSAQVSKEVRSRYSRRALQRVENGVETHWEERDALGRVTKETRYQLAPDSTGKTARQAADERIESVYTDSEVSSTTVQRTFKDGSQSLSCLDGLQRAWRTSWRRADTDSYVPLEEHCFSDLDESSVLGSWAWDYLPGGQAVRKDTPLRGSLGSQPWLAQETRAVTDEPAAVEADTLIATYDYTKGSSTGVEVFAHRIVEKLTRMDTKDPLLHTRPIFPLKGHNSTVNTIRGTYEDIIFIAEAHEVTIVDHFELIKHIQHLAGLTDLSGIEDAHNWLQVPDTLRDPEHISDSLSNFEVSSDDFDILNLFDLANIDDNEKLKTHAKSLYPNKLPTDNFWATADSAVQLTEQQGLGARCLSRRTSTTTAKTDGTFQRSVQWADHLGTQHLRLDQRYDPAGNVISHTRTLGEQTLNYTLERDVLGRVTKVTQPDNTTIERTYHGFSNQVCTLTVDGKVVASQALNEHGKLTTRTVGSREYRFADQTVTLPDKTRLQRLQTASSARFAADDNALYRETNYNGSTVLSSAPGPLSGSGWQQLIASAQVPGCRRTTEKTPRGTVRRAEWQSLRGQNLAARRADGRTRRVFLDSQGRLLRTCQEHEDVLYRYDELDRLQARRVHALTGAGQWQVHSEHDGFNRETARTFLRNGAPCFSQHMTWRGDGRLASKASWQDGELLRTEHFTYDPLDRLASYACDTSHAALCPQDANGTPVKAQTFSWDSLDNMTRCTSTPFEGDAVTETFDYAMASDPTRLTSMKTGKQTTALTWNSNGQLRKVGQQRTLDYNAAGQLNSVKDSTGALLTRYEYDGLQRLGAQYDQQHQTTHELRYDGDELIGQVCFDQAGKPTRHTSISPGLAQYDGNQVRWLIDDPQSGIVGQVCDANLQLAPLLPFGEGAALEEVISGYNGMRRDPVIGQYHAGHGYRCYVLALRRYAQPDWLSPFGEGGVNDYAHCPDPVNLHDPSGAIMISREEQKQTLRSYKEVLRETKPMQVGGRWRGLALSATLTILGIVASVMTGGAASVLFAAMTVCSVLSFSFEVASVLTEESHPELSRKLGYASLAFALASLTESAVGLIKKLPALVKNGMRAVRQVGKRVLHAKDLTRPPTSTARFSEYAMQNLKGARTSTEAVTPARRGIGNTLKAKASQLIDYLGEANFKDLREVEYWSLRITGKAQHKLYLLNNFAILPRRGTAAALLVGKGIETYIATSSIIALSSNDASDPVTPWGRYTVKVEQMYSWGQTGRGHLLQ